MPHPMQIWAYRPTKILQIYKPDISA